MPRHSVRRHFSCAPRQLFDIVADVEKYPEFLPWFVAVRVIRRRNRVLEVEQVVRLKMLRLRFLTTATMEPPRHIGIVSTAWPFRSFGQSWRFSPDPSGGTLVEFEIDVALRPSPLQALAALLVDRDRLSAAIVARFESRVGQLHRR